MASNDDLIKALMGRSLGGGLSSAPPEQPTTVLDQARQQYPILNNYDIGFVDSTGRPSSGRMLESWMPNEPGDTSDPRPRGLPLNQFGIENFNANTRPIDVLGDVVSHHLTTADPEIRAAYQGFINSLQPWQHNILKQQYAHAYQNNGERRPYDQWRESSGYPAYFRGYPFQQWDNADKYYTPSQMALMDRMMNYLKKPR
jgi:hypothetical protein